jgi:hypothetical protein
MTRRQEVRLRIPANKFNRPHADGGYRVGGDPAFTGYRSRTGGSSGNGRPRGGRSGQRGSGRGRGSRPRSEFEMYG